jgi:hypothetical protein
MDFLLNKQTVHVQNDNIFGKIPSCVNGVLNLNNNLNEISICLDENNRLIFQNQAANQKSDLIILESFPFVKDLGHGVGFLQNQLRFFIKNQLFLSSFPFTSPYDNKNYNMYIKIAYFPSAINSNESLLEKDVSQLKICSKEEDNFDYDFFINHLNHDTDCFEKHYYDINLLDVINDFLINKDNFKENLHKHYISFEVEKNDLGVLPPFNYYIDIYELLLRANPSNIIVNFIANKDLLSTATNGINFNGVSSSLLKQTYDRDDFNIMLLGFSSLYLAINSLQLMGYFHRYFGKYQSMINNSGFTSKDMVNLKWSKYIEIVNSLELLKYWILIGVVFLEGSNLYPGMASLYGKNSMMANLILMSVGLGFNVFHLMLQLVFRIKDSNKENMIEMQDCWSTNEHLLLFFKKWKKNIDALQKPGPIAWGSDDFYINFNHKDGLMFKTKCCRRAKTMEKTTHTFDSMIIYDYILLLDSFNGIIEKHNPDTILKILTVFEGNKLLDTYGILESIESIKKHIPSDHLIVYFSDLLIYFIISDLKRYDSMWINQGKMLDKTYEKASIEEEENKENEPQRKNTSLDLDHQVSQSIQSKNVRNQEEMWKNINESILPVFLACFGVISFSKNHEPMFAFNPWNKGHNLKVSMFHKASDMLLLLEKQEILSLTLCEKINTYLKRSVIQDTIFSKATLIFKTVEIVFSGLALGLSIGCLNKF